MEQRAHLSKEEKREARRLRNEREDRERQQEREERERERERQRMGATVMRVKMAHPIIDGFYIGIGFLLAPLIIGILLAVVGFPVLGALFGS